MVYKYSHRLQSSQPPRFSDPGIPSHTDVYITVVDGVRNNVDITTLLWFPDSALQ